MNVKYCCTACDQTTSSTIDRESSTVACMHCGAQIQFPADAIRDGELQRCLVCPSTELFVRKDFSQRVGLSIIVLGFIASSIALAYHHSVLSLAILIGTALLDAGLFLITGNVLTCYRCRCEYREVENLEHHPGFRLEVHERYRQQAARLADAERAMRRVTVHDESAGASHPSGT